MSENERKRSATYMMYHMYRDITLSNEQYVMLYNQIMTLLEEWDYKLEVVGY